ncbi:acyl-[acyl-carrier-protein] thioesterase [Gallalistipes aquisgranensis]|uniref:acyl-[acyl-carrier-protein] thioesterase n=1 Tax=Gallalistipes aquisgranensis TaxID=2779358 RepID=UPI001CF92E25|nr:acyl-ACP thioesterase domain-containing protein [Gallalistipes aquisgranensis]MBE5032470.1 acyl-[acyl-carrier-protein] thioesterase [Gallalistipes aquisgranensis]
MGETGCYTYRIEPRDVDFTRQATLMALGDDILHAAGEDADRNGFGLRVLGANNASWVLSRFAVEMERRPAQYEKLRVETWVGDVSRLMTTRNFRVLDEQGNRIGAAVSYWAMIDLSSRQPLDLRNNPDYLKAVRDEPSPIEKPGRIARVEPSRTEAHRVVYSDVDFNRHANSMKYLEWMVDMLPVEWHTERVCRRYTLNFMHEARYGDLLDICFEDAPVSLFEVRNAEGTALCRASLEWK